jgi:DNA-binding CsgD family transcriptional regulator
VFGDFPREGEALAPGRERERRLFELEWADADPNTVAELVRTRRRAAALARDVGEPAAVRRYRELLAPLGVIDELRIVCSTGGSPWATVMLYRTGGAPFADRDVATAAALAEPLAAAFRAALLDAALESRALADPPGSFVLGADGAVLVSSAAAEALLDGVPEPVFRAACASLTSRADVPSTVRLRGARGLLQLHSSPAKGVDGAVAVVVERARPADLAPVIMEALGLTARERAVVEMALRGTGREAIARRLRISADTVGDHLGAAYRKAGVGGRAELSAMLFGAFYEAPRARHDTPGPYGHFLGAAP